MNLPPSISTFAGTQLKQSDANYNQRPTAANNNKNGHIKTHLHNG